MMPMPPTSRLTAATAPSSAVSTRVVPVSVLTISFMSRTWKSSSSPTEMRLRSRKSCSTSFCTFSVGTPDRAESMTALTSVFPAMRRWNVRSGMRTKSSWSLPKADAPLDSSTPMTSHESLPSLMDAPRGLAPPKSSFFTVAPMMQTALPE